MSFARVRIQMNKSWNHRERPGELLSQFHPLSSVTVTTRPLAGSTVYRAAGAPTLRCTQVRIPHLLVLYNHGFKPLPRKFPFLLVFYPFLLFNSTERLEVSVRIYLTLFHQILCPTPSESSSFGPCNGLLCRCF